jgi:hypothetical protein
VHARAHAHACRARVVVVVAVAARSPGSPQKRARPRSDVAALPRPLPRARGHALRSSPPTAAPPAGGLHTASIDYTIYTHYSYTLPLPAAPQCRQFSASLLAKNLVATAPIIFISHANDRSTPSKLKPSGHLQCGACMCHCFQFLCKIVSARY